MQLPPSTRGVLHHDPVHDERHHDPQEAQAQPHVPCVRGLVPASSSSSSCPMPSSSADPMPLLSVTGTVISGARRFYCHAWDRFPSGHGRCLVHPVATEACLHVWHLAPLWVCSDAGEQGRLFHDDHNVFHQQCSVLCSLFFFAVFQERREAVLPGGTVRKLLGIVP